MEGCADGLDARDGSLEECTGIQQGIQQGFCFANLACRGNVSWVWTGPMINSPRNGLGWQIRPQALAYAIRAMHEINEPQFLALQSSPL